MEPITAAASNIIRTAANVTAQAPSTPKMKTTFFPALLAWGAAIINSEYERVVESLRFVGKSFVALSAGLRERLISTGTSTGVPLVVTLSPTVTQPFLGIRALINMGNLQVASGTVSVTVSWVPWYWEVTTPLTFAFQLQPSSLKYGWLFVPALLFKGSYYPNLGRLSHDGETATAEVTVTLTGLPAGTQVTVEAITRGSSDYALVASQLTCAICDEVYVPHDPTALSAINGDDLDGPSARAAVCNCSTGYYRVL